MTRPLLSHAVTIVVVAVFALGLWAGGDDLKLWWLRLYSAAVLAVVLLFAVLDRWVWRWKWVQELLPKMVPRDLRGTWKGTVSSRWVDPNTGERPEPKTAYLVVSQTLPTVHVVLHTDENKSRSTLGRVESSDGQVSLNYMYLARPDARVQEQSRMHHGAVSLDVSGLPAAKLKGWYWTDRDTQGDLEFTERVPKIADDYEAASKLFD